MSNVVETLAALEPRNHENIMDLVESAGVDVSLWRVRADGSPIANPRANPNFCYDWAFGGDKEPTVLCVWHENLKADGQLIVYEDNVQEMARRLEAAVEEWRTSPKIRGRAKSQAKRAWEFDRKLQHAFRKSQPLRLVLLEGETRDKTEPGIDTSSVHFRHLDEKVWRVESYDDRTGGFRVVRDADESLKDEEDSAFEHASNVSLDALVDAFVDIDARMSSSQREMLVGHATAPDGTLSMEKIAAIGGYDSYAVANLQYGTLGGMIAEALGVSGLANNIQAICEMAPERDEAGHFQWKVRPRVVEALTLLEIIPQPLTDKVEKLLLASRDVFPETMDEPPTVRRALIDARVGQGAYRKKMLRWWGGACSVTGCTVEAALIASHAVAWKDCSSRERLDHFNGLLLTGTLDRLFDAGLIGFSSDGRMLVSEFLTPADRLLLGLSGDMRLRKMHDRLLEYLERHRKLHSLS